LHVSFYYRSRIHLLMTVRGGELGRNERVQCFAIGSVHRPSVTVASV